jgi:hypothetical protein
VRPPIGGAVRCTGWVSSPCYCQSESRDRLRIYFAGVLHDDPCMHPAVRSWLVDLRRGSSESPAFVAVEWYPQVLSQYVGEWDEFMEAARRHWRCADERVVVEAADAIAYEAVLPAEVFDPRLILWLNGAGYDPHPGRTAYSVHAWRLGLRNRSMICPGILELSIAARDDALIAKRRPERDRDLADQILFAADNRRGDWAIAILGASHAGERWPDSTIQIVAKAGHDCSNPAFFGWEP